MLHAAAKRLLDQVQDIGAATLGDHQTFRERVRHRLATLIRALEEHPRYVHVAVLGLCTFFMDAKPLLDVLFGSRRADGPMAEAYIDFATDLLVRGLQLPR